MTDWLAVKPTNLSIKQPLKHQRKHMKQNPSWEADSFPTSKDIPHI
jgi:hypothetical protein